MAFRFLFLLALLTAVFPSCYYDNEEELYPNSTASCDTTNITYSSKIQPIMSTYCATTGCHNAVTGAAGIRLDTYENVRNEASGASFFCSIQHQSGCSPMPKNQPQLSACNIQTLIKWQQLNYPN